jgi:hypothetical protein
MSKKSKDAEASTEQETTESAPAEETQPSTDPIALVPLAQFRQNDDAMNYHAKQVEIHLAALGCKTQLTKTVQLTDDGEVPVATLYLVGQAL